MKTFKRIALVVVLLLIIAGVVVYFYLDRIIKSQVQTQATNSLNLNTTLDSAHLSIMGGEVTLNQLQIASPQGYGAAHMLELGKLNVAVKYGQLRQNPIHISSISINKPHFVIEQKGGKMNFNTVMDTMPKSDPSVEPIKVVIDQLDVIDAVVDVNLGELVGGVKVPNVSVPVPSLTLKSIGNADGANNGAAMKDVVMQLVTALAAKASDSGQLGGELQAMLKANVGEIAGKLSGDFQKQLGGITGNLGKVIPADLGKALPGDLGKKADDLTKGAGGDLTKSLGGLTGSLEGKKDKDKK